MNNPISNDISIEVRKKIDYLLKESKGNQLDDSWLNLILKEVTNKILMSKCQTTDSLLNESGISKKTDNSVSRDYKE